MILGFAALLHLGIKNQFYIWEFKIDLKPVVFGALCYFFNRKFRIGFTLSKIGTQNWNWGTNLLAFFSPFGLLALLIMAGISFKAITYQGVDNSATFLLATFFDIPATFFFSITTVLLEEMIFRGFVFDAVSNEDNFVLASFLSSGLWVLISFADVFKMHNLSVGFVLVGLLNLISVGFVCSALLLSSKSIWSSFSFRIGLMVFSSALLCGKQDETNSFFIANLPSFSSNGILFSLFNFSFVAILLKLHKSSKKLAIFK